MAWTQLAMGAPSSRQAGRKWYLVLWVHHLVFPLASTTLMDRLFDEKPKKSLDPSKRHVSLGIPINIAVGPLGFRAELDIDPKGGRCRSSRDLGTDRTADRAAR